MKPLLTRFRLIFLIPALALISVVPIWALHSGRHAQNAAKEEQTTQPSHQTMQPTPAMMQRTQPMMAQMHGMMGNQGMAGMKSYPGMLNDVRQIQSANEEKTR